MLSHRKWRYKMVHHLNLNPSPFSLIKSGIKTIELRLMDEKRQLIKIDDILIFTNTEDSSAKLTCVVKSIYQFDSFAELYKSLPLDKCGYMPDEILTASPEDMNIYYSTEKQKLYGVVGIEIELINNI